jgi:hypothetical protein
MKVFSLFLCLLLSNAASFVSAEEGHNHNHAPGHCPACDFDVSQASVPTPFKGEVKNWYVEDEAGPTGTFSLILALFGGGAIIAGIGLRKLNKGKFLTT